MSALPAIAHVRERGAATLMVILFLLIVIAFAVLVASSMSGSDIMDSASQQNSVNALFLAESGLERASSSYLSLTSCGSLLVGGPYTLGDGSFTISSATTADFSGAPLPTGECDVQSVGTVGLVTRTVEGILELPVSQAIAVGNGGVVLYCSSSSCTSSPSTGTTNNLHDVYCASATDCLAVGDNGTAIEWNGSGWTAIGSPVLAGANLTAVACQPGNGNNCFATDGAQLFNWNGSNWSVLAVPPFTINDLTCTVNGATTICYAVGNGGNIAFYTYGGTWSAPLTPPPATYNLNGVDCFSYAACMAVAINNPPHLNFDVGGGTAWTASNPDVKSKSASLQDVSCPGTTDCWAVGGNKAGFEHWISGSMAYFAGPGVNLSGISCRSTSQCWAVGYGTVMYGSSLDSAPKWTPLTGVPSDTLNAVSIPSASTGGGSKVLVLWHEVVS
ncbi:MAG: hypothetical protein ACYDDO_03680 [Acidiferrobacterales bacterium]